MIEFTHILCPIDFSDASIRALTYAAAFATWYEAQLEVLHVVPAFEDGPASGHSRSIGGSRAPTSRDAIVSEIRRALESVGATSLDPAVLDADLIVMGTQGMGGLELMLYGSNTQHVVRAATSPVLTVHA